MRGVAVGVGAQRRLDALHPLHAADEPPALAQQRHHRRRRARARLALRLPPRALGAVRRLHLLDGAVALRLGLGGRLLGVEPARRVLQQPARQPEAARAQPVEAEPERARGLGRRRGREARQHRRTQQQQRSRELQAEATRVHRPRPQPATAATAAAAAAVPRPQPPAHRLGAARRQHAAHEQPARQHPAQQQRRRAGGDARLGERGAVDECVVVHEQPLDRLHHRRERARPADAAHRVRRRRAVAPRREQETARAGARRERVEQRPRDVLRRGAERLAHVAHQRERERHHERARARRRREREHVLEVRVLEQVLHGLPLRGRARAPGARQSGAPLLEGRHEEVLRGMVPHHLRQAGRGRAV